MFLVEGMESNSIADETTPGAFTLYTTIEFFTIIAEGATIASITIIKHNSTIASITIKKLDKKKMA